jgi:predicted helicase
MQELRPDERHNWLNLSRGDFESLIPLASKETEAATKSSQERALFKLYSLGISTNRDEWVYDFDSRTLGKKVRFLEDVYRNQLPENEFDTRIKWSRNLKRRLQQGRHEDFDAARIVRAAYRPFCNRWLYDSALFIDEGGSKDAMFPVGKSNAAICFSDVGSRADCCVLAVNGLADLHFGASVDGYQQVPLFRYQDDQRADNITDWGLDRFRKHYSTGRTRQSRSITKDAIFYYVYAVLHDPLYRERYSFDLKRSFPRVPFYADFWQWVEWGRQLKDFHIDYELASPLKLKRKEAADEKSRKAGLSPKCVLKADKTAGRIIVDSETTLEGVPAEAWEYRLGNRSALEWVLDQYKERAPKDPTIRERFNTYRFADYKEKVIDLLARVTTVSVETQRIVEEMRKAPR